MLTFVFTVISRRLHKHFVNRKNAFLAAMIRVAISPFAMPFRITVDPRVFKKRIYKKIKNLFLNDKNNANKKKKSIYIKGYPQQRAPTREV